MVTRCVDQIRQVRRKPTGLRKSQERVGKGPGSGLQEPQHVAQIRRNGDEKQIRQPCQERMGQGSDPVAHDRPILVSDAEDRTSSNVCRVAHPTCVLCSMECCDRKHAWPGWFRHGSCHAASQDECLQGPLEPCTSPKNACFHCC